MNFISIKIYSGKRVFVLAKNYFCQYGKRGKAIFPPSGKNLATLWQNKICCKKYFNVGGKHYSMSFVMFRVSRYALY